VFAKIKSGTYHFNHVEFQKVSEEGKSLLRKLLQVDADKRISGEQALRDPWFRKFKNIEKGCEEDKLDASILESLRRYKGKSKFKKAVLCMLVKMVRSSKEVDNLRESFHKLDLDGCGLIDSVELKSAMRSSSRELIRDEEVESIITEVDYFGYHKITYSEFLSATISIKKIMKYDEKKIVAIFKQFDCD